MHPASGQTVGRVVGLWRYPVKSMAAQSLSGVEVSWHGLVGDRRWAFVRDGQGSSGFPWLTIRDRHDMASFLPSFEHPDRPDRSDTRVRTPTGATYDVTDPALAAALWPDGARVIRHNGGLFDTFPISLISTQSIRWLSEATGSALSAQRFRPNLLIEAIEDRPFVEESWVGRELQIGQLRMRIDKRDGRCQVITVDPETGTRDPAILRTVVGQRSGCLGVYGSTVVPGAVAISDIVILA